MNLVDSWIFRFSDPLLNRKNLLGKDEHRSGYIQVRLWCLYAWYGVIWLCMIHMGIIWIRVLWYLHDTYSHDMGLYETLCWSERILWAGTKTFWWHLNSSLMPLYGRTHILTCHTYIWDYMDMPLCMKPWDHDTIIRDTLFNIFMHDTIIWDIWTPRFSDSQRTKTI